MSSTSLSFKGINHLGDTYLMNKLELNLKTWFDWAFLQSGGWTDVSPPSLGPNGGDYSILRRVDDPSYSSGTVYESIRKDWVWETGVDYVDYNSNTQNPTSPASIFVDAVLTVPNHINYPLGRVVFNTPISSSSVVTASYSFRNIQVYLADSARWWTELQYRSYDAGDPQFSQLDDGSWALGSNHRIQMPVVIIEATPRAVSTGYQLGDGSSWVEQDILVHVLAEDRYMRNKLVDIFRGQFDKSIWLFDDNSVTDAGDYPLDFQGEIVDSSKTFPSLVDKTTGHRWKSCRFMRTQTSEIESFNSRLYQGVIRMTCEVILND